MPTSPFPVSVLDKIESRFQAVKWSLTLKQVIQFRAYCCDIDSDAIMGIAKEPVPIINITPNPVCFGHSVTWDISDSYAPGSTLTSWSIDFGDGTAPVTGINFPADTTHGTHTYGAIGSYTITVTIEEGGGKNQTGTVEVDVVDCSFSTSTAYCSTDGSGVFMIDLDAASPDWIAINNGLEGDALFVRSLVLQPVPPGTPQSDHKLWVATKDGVYHSDNGGGIWKKMKMGTPSNVEFGDSPAATEDELDWIHVVIDPTDTGKIYVLASKVV